MDTCEDVRSDLLGKIKADTVDIKMKNNYVKNFPHLRLAGW